MKSLLIGSKEPFTSDSTTGKVAPFTDAEIFVPNGIVSVPLRVSYSTSRIGTCVGADNVIPPKATEPAEPDKERTAVPSDKETNDPPVLTNEKVGTPKDKSACLDDVTLVSDWA